MVLSSSFAQEEEVKKDLSNGTIEEQFDYIISNSNRFQEYKVVKRTWLDQIASNVSDSIDVFRKDLKNINQNVVNQNSEIEKLKAELEATNETLDKTNIEKDNISFFGISMKKGAYKSIMWAIVGGLAFLLVVFILRFLRSNSVTAQTKKRYDEIFEEFEAYKHKSIEDEQVLRRKLQDEINKRL